MKKLLLLLIFFPSLCWAASPLVEIYSHGGECACCDCHSGVLIATNGTVTLSSQGKTKVIENGVDATELARISLALTSGGVSAARQNKFTGTCPMAVDGQETVYVVYLSEESQIKLPSCTYAIDAEKEPFKTLNAIRDRIFTDAREWFTNPQD